MTGINGILSIGRQALFSQQKAINVTGNNIANVNTPGYSRQRVLMETAPVIQTPIGGMGTGVTIDSIERIVDQFIGERINDAAMGEGRWEAQNRYLERTEIVFNESNGFGLNQAMGEFWSAWQDLSNSPSGNTERTVLLAKADTLANTFRQVRSDLNKVQQDIDVDVVDSVTNINSMAAEIEALNLQIAELQADSLPGSNPRDRRDALLQDLAGLIDFTAAEGTDGRVTVTLADGNDLVGVPPFGTLVTTTNATTGFQDVAWSAAPAVSLNNTLTGGELRGALTARDSLIAGHLNDIDALAGDMITRINTQHTAGFDINGTAGLAFFTGTNAGDMAVNPTVLADANRVAAAGTAAGAPGGNANAIVMANLQSTLTMSGGTANYDDFYRGIVSNVGIQVKDSQVNRDYQQETLQHLEGYRDSVSGVSLDEEMVNLVKFQHAYDAAAKLISVVDEMLTTLINI